MAVTNGLHETAGLPEKARAVVHSLELDMAVVKVLDNDSLDNFSALGGMQTDFHCTVSKVYLAQFQINSDANIDEQASSGGEREEKEAPADADGFVTLNIDYETGRVEQVREDGFGAVEVKPTNKKVCAEAQRQLEDGCPVVYLTQRDFNSLETKIVRRCSGGGAMALTLSVQEFFNRLDPKVFLGCNPTTDSTVLLASSSVSAEYARQASWLLFEFGWLFE